MATRRDVVGGMLSGGVGAALGFWPAGSARAEDRVLALGELGPRALNSFEMKLLASSSRIAVPSYRFGVVMRSSISASGDAGNVTMNSTADLVGVDLALLRRIAGECHADFVAQLAAAGRTLVPQAEIEASSGFAKLKPTPVPFVKKPFADARTSVLVSPEGLPLISQHSDAPLSDQGAMALGNWRAINQMCVDLKCVVMIPNLLVDFAQLSGSGHSVYGGSASVSIKPGLFLVPLSTYVSAHFAKIAIAGPGGKIILKQRVAIGQAGEFVNTGTVGNRAEVEWWNSLASNASSGAARPTLSYEYSSYEYRVDREAFAKACLDAAKVMNRFYAEPAATYPAKS